MTARNQKPVEEETTTVTKRKGLPVDLGMGDMDPVEKLFSKLGSTPGVRVRVSKKKANGASHCFESETADLDLDWIRDNYGGGTYVVRVFVNNEFRDSTEVMIEEPLTNDNGERRKATPREETKGDPLATISGAYEKALEFMKNNQPKPVETPWGELAGVLKTLAEVARPPAENRAPSGPQAGFRDLFDVFNQGVEFGKQLSGKTPDPDWKSDAVAALKDIIPQAVGVIAQIQSHAGGAPVPDLNPVTTVETVPMAQPENSATPVVDDAMIREGLKQLRSYANMGLEPDFVIDMAAVQVQRQDERVARLVYAALDREFDALIALDPQIGQSQKLTQWFRLVYDGLRSGFAAADPVGDDSPRTGGDTGDDGGYAPTGPEGVDAS